MRGRKPDGEALQTIKGNPRKQRRRTPIDAVVIEPLPDGSPRHLSVMARKFWTRVAPEVQRLNFVRATDLPVLERYCEALAEYWAIQMSLRGKKRVYWTNTNHGRMKRIEPYVRLQRDQEVLLLNYEDRIGLNPVARQRIMIGMAQSQGMLPLPGSQQSGEDGSERGELGGAGAGAPADESPIGALNTTKH